MKEIYIVAAKRTPFGRFRGFFKDETAIDLGVMALKQTLSAIKLDAKEVEALFMGNVIAAGLGENMARQVALRSGMNNQSVATTINDVCGSSLKALRLAQAQMSLGDLDLVAVGGSESMTNAPYLVKVQDKEKANDHLKSSLLTDGLIDAFSHQHMGLTAENVAEKYQVSRQEMDEFSLNSHQKAVKAINQALFDEILPIKLNGTTLNYDESVRLDTSLVALKSLKPVFKADGKVTAGNCSPLNDGASMVILATKEKCQQLNLKPIAKLGAFAEVGFDPDYMGYTPYYAVKKLLAKTKKSIDDYDAFEINEAFASQAIAVSRDLKIPAAKLNIFGGAIALGHPLGATGTRLIATAINVLEHKKGQTALVSLCIGGGQAIAFEVERI